MTYDLANTILLLGVVGWGFPAWMTDNGLPDSALSIAAGIAGAIPGGLAAGRLIERFSPLRVLRTALLVAVIGIGGVVLAGVAEKPDLLWAAGPLGGASIAATWSADRVLMARLSPPRYFGEFYGLYATVGRFAAILGPLLWGLVADVLGFGQNAAMGTLFCFVVTGLIGLHRIEDREKAWAQQDLA